jgi:hypothetical protein
MMFLVILRLYSYSQSAVTINHGRLYLRYATNRLAPIGWTIRQPESSSLPLEDSGAISMIPFLHLEHTAVR